VYRLCGDICFIGICLRLLVCWRAHESTNIDDGRPVSSANNVAECQQACLDDHECTGVDWNQRGPQGGKCWKSGPWSGDRNEDSSTGVTHYDLDRNCVGGRPNICLLKKTFTNLSQFLLVSKRSSCWFLFKLTPIWFVIFVLLLCIYIFWVKNRFEWLWNWWDVFINKNR